MFRRIKYFFSTEAGLQLRMTLWVSLAVLIVAAVVMSVASSMLRGQYESELRSRLSDDMDASIKIIDQRMQRAEYITKTAASFIEENLETADTAQFKSMIYGLMNDIECINAVSLMFKVPDNDSIAIAYNSYKSLTNGDSRQIVPAYVRQEYLGNDENWIASYHKGKELWSRAYSPAEHQNVQLQCFSVPISNKDGKRVGMMCTMIMESWLVEIIKQYKTRRDIDLTIYDTDGVCMVTPDEYILKLSPDELLTEERTLDRFRWRIIFSADRHIITDKMTTLMWQMAFCVLFLLFFIAIAIALTVRYVARPFAQNQEQISKAKAAMERELQIAADTQQTFVPHKFPPFPDRNEISIYACLHPALEVGGDMYDYFIKDDKLYFCLGDVSGKGMPASLFMAATLYLFRFVATEMPASDAMRKMNDLLSINNEKCTFVTFFYGCLDLKTGMFEYCNAGHNSPILVHNGEAQYFAPSESMPLAAWEDYEFPSNTIQLAKDDVILLYTDGITEAMNEQNEEFGAERTLRCVNECTSMEPQPIIDTLLQQVHQHAAGTPQSDDITMLCIKYDKTIN